MAPTMQTFVLVRPMAGMGACSAEEVKQLAEKSNAAIRACHTEHGEQHHIKWVTSYLTDDVVVCVYKASDEHVLRVRSSLRGVALWTFLGGFDKSLLQEHAERVGIPCGDILAVRHVASPSSANETTPAEALHLASAHLSGCELPTPQREAAQAAHQHAR